jgi:hypothetical protein
MELLVEDAIRLWRDIPDCDLTGAVEAAIKEAGNFMATAGLVARCYERREAPKALELGQSKTSGAKALEHAREWEKNWNMMTEEEQNQAQQQHREFFSGLRARLGGGA